VPQPEHLHALQGLPVPERDEVSESTGRYWDKCVEKLGLVPNVLRAYSFDDRKLAGFTALYNELMLGESGLSKLEREMIAVVVSAANRCYYCLVAHGSAVRELSGDPQLGEMLVMNWRVAELSERQRAMLGFAWKLTLASHEIGEEDRAALRRVGFTDREIWDIANVAGFFNMSNRVASAVDLMPNPEYHGVARG
jgi:uncharacterized peroxidase-related enzyme